MPLCCRVLSNIKMERYEEAIVDATLALRELHCIVNGMEYDLWEVMENRDQEDVLVSPDFNYRNEADYCSTSCSHFTLALF